MKNFVRVKVGLNPAGKDAIRKCRNGAGSSTAYWDPWEHGTCGSGGSAQPAAFLLHFELHWASTVRYDASRV